ncbi:5-oxoprolinase subunit PxpB [Mycolicibacterium iranicum]|uniref:Allophanate hydrolase n=1 Tax=Mycolicibacterium iranicum TaxID=912594 RepID=A0A178LHV6_MYCIR|nr:5-oxoprolinase subunit PxpB [Mycolicibacterium iranicum]OAN30166.1 allophanate hydrolase [Mycolicibacterium iranicum]
MKLLPYGARALLVEVENADDVLAWSAAIESAALDVVDVVPGARTVYVSTAGPEHLVAVRDAISRLSPAPVTATAGAVVEVPTVYDGPDLDEVARRTGMTPNEVVAVHTAHPWRVAFTGFAPGFGYLVRQHDPINVPRRDEPRPSIPAGSVALAGEFSGIYPTASPGGWQLIGRTELRLFDLDADPPALLRPGTAVQFVAVDS